jgi:glycerate 2-kinase
MSEAIRRDAVTCALAGIAAVDPGDLVRSALEQHPVDGHVSLIAVGKAAGAMASAAVGVIGSSVRRGVVISPDPVAIRVDGMSCFVGGHPIPNERGAQGARAIVEMAGSLRADETLLCLVSGGASALTTLPAADLSVGDVASATRLLLRAGATIDELNCVRKHIDRLKGGRLASLAFPARVVALVLSDVVGDSLATIASGPTVADPTTIADAISVLRSRGVWKELPGSIRAHLESRADESPKPGDPRLAHAESHVIGSNVTAAEAACSQARALGYAARIVTTSLTGEAGVVGGEIVTALRDERERVDDRVALIYGGETTVTVRGAGTGGRNQELALCAAIAMDGVPGMAVVSLGTDGVDGPTDAAGAVADGDSIGKARAYGLDAHAALAANDAHTFWKSIGGLVRTGPTGTNVMDIIVALAVPDGIRSS